MSKVKNQPIGIDAEEKKWRAEDDLRTLTRAEEIKKDKSRMDAVRKLAKERLEEMQKFMTADSGKK